MRFPRGKKRGATLSVQTEGAFALELQHLEPIVVERINAFFGYGAVEKLRIVHGPVPQLGQMRKKKAAAARPLKPGEEKQIETLTQGISDPKLRKAVADLGRTVLTSTNKKPHETV